MARETPVAVWDITIWLTGDDAELSEDTVKQIFTRVAKKWCFQRESAGEDDDREHFQCRISCKTKKRLQELKATLGEAGRRWHLTKTSKENQTNDFYACKDETRVAGPWRDDDTYVPRQWRLEDDQMYPWQRQIAESLEQWDARSINVLYDPQGSRGKSTISHICRLKHGCYMLKNRGKGEDMLQDMLCQLTARRDRRPTGVFVDLTRSTNQKQLKSLYDALEDIKNGYVTDWRYAFKQWDFDSPVVWVMCNTLPNPRWLSRDRWRFWRINGHSELQRLSTDRAEEMHGEQQDDEE